MDEVSSATRRKREIGLVQSKSCEEVTRAAKLPANYKLFSMRFIIFDQRNQRRQPETGDWRREEMVAYIRHAAIWPARPSCSNGLLVILAEISAECVWFVAISALMLFRTNDRRRSCHIIVALQRCHSSAGASWSYFQGGETRLFIQCLSVYVSVSLSTFITRDFAAYCRVFGLGRFTLYLALEHISLICISKYPEWNTPENNDVLTLFGHSSQGKHLAK
ncbi:hypothetical protein J6590_031063 [Homalodisca vitripennis]|nr:hypothetical protein J6590_031063 [Homalodisca vitripennis]